VPAPLAAERVIPVPPSEVLGRLEHLEAHWALADRWVEVLSLHPADGRATAAVVRLRGPMGVRRIAHTRVLSADGDGLRGEARLGRTRAAVRWALAPDGPGATRVRLEADVVACGPLDRLLLAAGGRRWLAARFRSALDRLAELSVSSAARTSPRPARA